MVPMERHEWLPTDLAGAIARAGVDVTLPERQLEDAIRDAIGERRGYASWVISAATTRCVPYRYESRSCMS